MWKDQLYISKEGTLDFDNALNELNSGDNRRVDSGLGILSFEEMQKQHIIKALEQSNWKISGPNGAAFLLKMNAKTLTSKMRKFKISRDDR